jgi:hypothetical protein
MRLIASRQERRALSSDFRSGGQCIVDGDDLVGGWAVVGVLEDVQGGVPRMNLPEGTFFPWFGSRTREHWFELLRGRGTGPFAPDGNQA